MKSVLIVGCGWLGSALATELKAQGVAVLATCQSDERATELTSLSIDNIRLSLAEQTMCPESARIVSGSIAVVAVPPKARRGGGIEFPAYMSALMQFLLSVGINEVILVSSTSVYAANNCDVTEFTEPNPDTHSGKIMLAAEQAVTQTEGMNSAIVRMAGLCGPKREPGRFMAGKTDLAGAESPVNLIYQEDSVNLILLMLQQKPWEHVFNGCAPHHPTKKAFYTAMAVKQGLVAPTFNEAESAPFKCIDGTLAERSLGMRFRWPDPMSW